MRDNELDNQIDDAARQLTAGEPGGDLRARVLARIAEAGREHYVASGFSRTGWIAVPVALATAAVIAIVVMRPPHDVQPNREVQQVHEVQEISQVQPVQQAQRVLAERAPNPVNVMNGVNLVNAVNRVNNGVEVESPFAPAPLDIAPLTIDAIPPAQAIVVADLSVSPIEVRPLDAPDLLAQ